MGGDLGRVVGKERFDRGRRQVKDHWTLAHFGQYALMRPGTRFGQMQRAWDPAAGRALGKKSNWIPERGCDAAPERGNNSFFARALCGRSAIFGRRHEEQAQDCGCQQQRPLPSPAARGRYRRQPNRVIAEIGTQLCAIQRERKQTSCSPPRDLEHVWQQRFAQPTATCKRRLQLINARLEHLK